MFLPANITLKFGDSGDFVSELQRRLAAVNAFNSDNVNGFFDGATASGVSHFQSMSGITADGVAGPETLRRLNGVISGDTSSTNNHQEEQDRLRQEEAARQIQMEAAAQQQRAEAERLEADRIAAQTPQWHQQVPAQQPEMHYAQEAAAPQHQQAQPQMSPTEQMQQQMAQAQQRMAAQAAQPQQHTHTPQPELQHPPAQVQQPQAHVIPAQQHAAVQVHTITSQQPATAAAAAAAVHAATAPQHQAPAVTQAVEPAAQKGIVGRAMQYANEMVQKLSNYFESKLPSPVIDEVKNIGQTMAKNGVREVAIPTGPEQQRGADAPARGPQQQQTAAQVPHRG